MIIFNATIDSAIMAKLTNLGIMRCSAEDNWPKERATPGKENLEEEGNFNLLVEKSGNKKSSNVLSCLEYIDEKYNEHIDGNDSDQEWQGDGMLKDWEGGWREGERARDPRPILKRRKTICYRLNIDNHKTKIHKIRHTQSWSVTWESNHSIERGCVNVDPRRVFAVLTSKSYRPGHGFFFCL